MLAYLMLFDALYNAVCLHNAFLSFYLFLQMLFVFMLCLGLLTHSLFISSMILQHAQCCWFLLILCSHHFLYEGAMCSLEK